MLSGRMAYLPRCPKMPTAISATRCVCSRSVKISVQKAAMSTNTTLMSGERAKLPSSRASRVLFSVGNSVFRPYSDIFVSLARGQAGRQPLWNQPQHQLRRLPHVAKQELCREAERESEQRESGKDSHRKTL